MSLHFEKLTEKHAPELLPIWQDLDVVQYTYVRNIQNVEDAIFKKASSKNVRDILLIRTNILAFRNIVFPQRKLLKTLEIKDMEFLIEALDVYFSDLVDHIEKIWDTLENYKELIEGVHDAHQSLLSNKINDIMKLWQCFYTRMERAILCAS